METIIFGNSGNISISILWIRWIFIFSPWYCVFADNWTNWDFWKTILVFTVLIVYHIYVCLHSVHVILCTMFFFKHILWFSHIHFCPHKFLFSFCRIIPSGFCVVKIILGFISKVAPLIMVCILFTYILIYKWLNPRLKRLYRTFFPLSWFALFYFYSHL